MLAPTPGEPEPGFEPGASALRVRYTNRSCCTGKVGISPKEASPLESVVFRRQYPAQTFPASGEIPTSRQGDSNPATVRLQGGCSDLTELCRRSFPGPATPRRALARDAWAPGARGMLGSTRPPPPPGVQNPPGEDGLLPGTRTRVMEAQDWTRAERNRKGEGFCLPSWPSLQGVMNQ